jgi:DNA-directed RNA polymerase subunit N (RpoN/RPB10)
MVTCISCGKDAITVHGNERRCPHCGKYFKKTYKEQENLDEFKEKLKEVLEPYDR